MKGKDEITGGLTDELTIKDVAKKHNITVEEVQKELDAGIKVEMEHTDSKEKAEEIALDHLFEIPDYYKRLDKMEKDAEKEGVNENITAYARRMRELAGLADGNQHKTLKTVQDGESSFEGGATFYAKDMVGIVNENKSNEMPVAPSHEETDANQVYESDEEKDEFETHQFEQKKIEEGENDAELYTLNENTIIVLDFLDEEDSE